MFYNMLVKAFMSVLWHFDILLFANITQLSLLKGNQK